MYIDINWDYNCLALGAEGIDRLVEDAKSAGFRQVNFRVSNKGALNCRTRVGTSYHERLDAFGPDFDPLATFIEHARRKTLRAGIWLDLFEGCYDEFLRSHPHLFMMGPDGDPGMSGVPAFCCSEVCDYYLSLLEEWLPLEPDSVLLCTKSAHVPKNFTGRRELDSGYNPPALDRYRRRFGNGTIEREKLALVHGDSLVEFFGRARRLLNARNVELSLALPANGVPLNGTTREGVNIRLDWRHAVVRKCADTIALTNNRHESYLLYSPAGRTLLAEALQLCERNDVVFHAYVFADHGVYAEVEKQAGRAGLLGFIPLHLAYLRDQHLQGVLFHDLDLLHVTPEDRRTIWKAVGEAAGAGHDGTEAWMTYFGETFNGQLHARFLKHAEPSRSVTPPSARADRHPGLNNYSMELSADRVVPDGWMMNVPSGNDKLFAEYDWKVMHGDARSGRTFSGRSSVLVGGKNGAGLSDKRCVSWETRFPAPAFDEQVIARVWAHGEGLIGVESAGLSVKVLTPDGEILDAWTATIPDQLTFPWTEIRLRCSLEHPDSLLQVCLFLQFLRVADSEGRLWFDQFEIISAHADEVSP